MKTTPKRKAIVSDSLLLLTAVIWGFGFVAQRAGMEFVGPFSFSAIRFVLGGVALLPLIWWSRKRTKVTRPGWKATLAAGAVAGLVLFLGVTFQQLGIVSTSAGKAGFITGMYVVLVPILGKHIGFHTGRATWIGGLLAVAGLYMLSVGNTESLAIQKGDLLVLVGAVFWAIHVLVIAHIAAKVDPIELACVQFLICALLSGGIAIFTERCDAAQFNGALVPILYGGLVSVGIAYTLQVVAQKNAPPAHAAIILSLESLFAVVGGILILNEAMSIRALLGCCLMLAGMILSQIAQGKTTGELHHA